MSPRQPALAASPTLVALVALTLALVLRIGRPGYRGSGSGAVDTGGGE